MKHVIGENAGAYNCIINLTGPNFGLMKKYGYSGANKSEVSSVSHVIIPSNELLAIEEIDQGPYHAL